MLQHFMKITKCLVESGVTFSVMPTVRSGLLLKANCCYITFRASIFLPIVAITYHLHPNPGRTRKPSSAEELASSPTQSSLYPINKHTIHIKWPTFAILLCSFYFLPSLPHITSQNVARLPNYIPCLGRLPSQKRLTVARLALTRCTCT